MFQDTMKQPKLSNRWRKVLLASSIGAYTVGSLTLLNVLWYQHYPRSAFHFFNDNAQWCQMDKMGHAWTTYNSGRVIMQAMKWAGFSTSPFQVDMGSLVQESMKWAGFTRTQSLIIGETFGILYMSSIEIMDGFSQKWGFSWGDELANVGGGALFSLQQHFWHEQRFQLKMSYHPTSFPKLRPNELGSNFAEQILKDYNGQTYWMSINIASFLKKTTKFPKWINVSFGYGATNMICGKPNDVINIDKSVGSYAGDGQTSELITANGDRYYFTRYRKFYVSLDLDFTKIKTKSKFLRGLFCVLNGFKLPFPAVEFSSHGTKFQPFYF